MALDCVGATALVRVEQRLEPSRPAFLLGDRMKEERPKLIISASKEALPKRSRSCRHGSRVRRSGRGPLCEQQVSVDRPGHALPCDRAVQGSRKGAEGSGGINRLPDRQRPVRRWPAISRLRQGRVRREVVYRLFADRHARAAVRRCAPAEVVQGRTPSVGLVGHDSLACATGSRRGQCRTKGANSSSARHLKDAAAAYDRT